MQLVLVVDDMASVREPIAAALRSAGYQAICAATGDEALKLVRERQPALVLLDRSMPGKDGLTVLREMRANPATAHIPVILLTASSDSQLILEAAKLGARDYILKATLKIPTLIERIGKQLSGRATAGRSSAVTGPHPVVEKLSADDTRRRIKQAEIKALPRAIVELLSLTASPSGSMVAVGDCLKKEPMLTGRLLQLANSAAYSGHSRRISTINDAVLRIGLASVRNMATSVGVFDSAGGKNVSRHFARSWRHCLAVAALMDQLTPAADAPPGEAYLTGLCHELPELMICQHFPDHYGQAIETSRRERKNHRLLLADSLGMPYVQVADLLLNQLALPVELNATIREYLNRTLHRKTADAGSKICRLLTIANLYAHGLQLGSAADDRIRPIALDEYTAALGEHHPVISDEMIRSQVASTCAVLGGLVALNEPKPPPLPIRVAYLRDERYAEFDPLLALLKATASHVLMKPSPTAAFDVVVAVAPTAALAAVLTRQFTNTPVLSLHEENGDAPEKRLPLNSDEVTRFLSSVAEGISKKTVATAA